MRLDQYLAKKKEWSLRTARERIAAGHVFVGGLQVSRHTRLITKFSRVEYDNEILQEGLSRVYLIANKPKGVVSATRDSEHRTILDGITIPERESLHLAGRLDRSSTGLILLSNDGRWTEAITIPENHLEKVYLVETEIEIPGEAVARFLEGFHFLPEDIVTRPATLEILDKCRARVTIHEGRYHQIKRMFHKLGGIRLRSLHREKIGGLSLPHELKPGQWRHLTREEQDLVFSTPPLLSGPLPGRENRSQ